MMRLIVLKRSLAREDGQALVEYALILALITLAAVALLSATGTEIQGLLSRVHTALQSAI